jgi:hypothetical protein
MQQPLPPHLACNHSVKLGDWTQAKVVRPPTHHAIESADLLLHVQPAPLRWRSTRIANAISGRSTGCPAQSNASCFLEISILSSDSEKTTHS